ncbi:MAG: hypothetical protein AABX85_04175 [Nanoarchaeota archaeon]
MRNRILFVIIFFVLFLSIFTSPLVRASPIENVWYNTLAFLRIIEITNANHLNSDRVVISDIYNEVKELDNIWSEEIPDGEYVRVKFEHKLTNKNDITIYPRIVSGNPKIEVYEKGKNEVIAEFSNLNNNKYNKFFLTNLQGTKDVFDLRVVDGSIEIEHIIDPEETVAAVLVEEQSTDVPYTTCTASNVGADDTLYCGATLTIDGGEFGYVNSTHTSSVTSDATLNNVTICTRFFLTSKLDDNAADTTKIYVGENSTGSWAYTQVNSCSGTGCTAWETEATRCYDVIGTINTAIKAKNVQISIYVSQSDADNNQYPSVDYNYVYINYTTPPDTIYPTFNNYWDDNASLTGSGTGNFNVTLTNTNGTVLLEINNTNITATNLTASVYNVSYSFTSAGTYTYRWHSWGNGTDNNYNKSIDRSYTVNSSDICTCPGLNNNWEINMADYCVISTTCNLGTGNITFIGIGNATFNVLISTKNMEYPTTDQTLFIGPSAMIRTG